MVIQRFQNIFVSVKNCFDIVYHFQGLKWMSVHSNLLRRFLDMDIYIYTPNRDKIFYESHSWIKIFTWIYINYNYNFDLFIYINCEIGSFNLKYNKFISFEFLI